MSSDTDTWSATIKFMSALSVGLVGLETHRVDCPDRFPPGGGNRGTFRRRSFDLQ